MPVTGIADVSTRISEIKATVDSLSNKNSATNAAGFASTLKSVSGTGESFDTASGTDIVNQAKKYLGTPYVFGGEDLSEGGLDCSGLVQRVLKDLGMENPPRLTWGQSELGTPVNSLAEAQPGDLIFPKDLSHVVIYAGNGKIVHSPMPGMSVEYTDQWYKENEIGAIRRVAAPVATPSAANTNVSSLLSSLGLTGAAASGGTTDIIAAAQRAMFSAAIG